MKNDSTVTLSTAALENFAETGLDVDLTVADDVAALRSGKHTSESLLAECLDGADDDREQGWRDYVSAVVAAAAEPPVHVIQYRGDYANTSARNWTTVEFPEPCVFRTAKAARAFVAEYMQPDEERPTETLVDEGNDCWEGRRNDRRIYDIRIVERAAAELSDAERAML